MRWRKEELAEALHQPKNKLRVPMHYVLKNDQANQLVSRNYRPPFVVPEKV